MPWGYTFLNLPEPRISSQTAVSISVYISEYGHLRSIWHCFDTVWHCFDPGWHCIDPGWHCIDPGYEEYGTLDMRNMGP